MTLATQHTHVRAARKRGGGLARRYVPALPLAGRPAEPAGGDLKSLCCAAAGLFSSALPATAGASTPTTGVRRAPPLGTPLRYRNSPHAQPVVGYGHVICFGRPISAEGQP